MFKRFILAIFCLIVSNSFVYAASVDITSEVYEQETIFTYNFQFSEEDSYRSFSFEKPRDARVDYVVDGKGNGIKYSVAGDYFIVQPETIQNNEFRIQFSSQYVSNEVRNKGKYSVYVNFNFPVERINYEVTIVDEFSEITSFFPRGYQVTESGSFAWTIDNVESDTLFLIEFENSSGLNVQDLWGINVMIIAGMVIIILIALAMLFVFFVLPRRRITEKVPAQTKEVKKETVEEVSSKTESKPAAVENKETYDEIINKYLTENEKEVVEIVKEHSGITQYDILNYAPKLTKSNLSKIITKLHGKKILNRIRVGKINKIYLGEKLEHVKKE